MKSIIFLLIFAVVQGYNIGTENWQAVLYGAGLASLVFTIIIKWLRREQ
jgi:hypothetical protein